ncbi:MAG: hypothetical protein EZS28_035947, partial [Streblomastix strix]
ERTQTLTVKVLEAMTDVQASEIDFGETNIQDEQNGYVRRREIQCLFLQPFKSIHVSDEELNLKCNPTGKILLSAQTLAQYNFQIGEGMQAHLYEQQEDNLAIDILSQLIQKLREAERKYFAKARNKNGTYANYFILFENLINSHLNSETWSHMLGAQIIAVSEKANKDAIGIMKQKIAQIPNVLTKEIVKDQIARWKQKGIYLIPVGKDDEKQYWPGYDPGEHNLDLRVACVRKEYDSEDDSETLQPAKPTRQEF